MGRNPIAVSRFCSQAGEGPFLTPRHEPQAESRAQRRRFPKSSVTLTGQGNVPFTGFAILSLYVPMMSLRDRERCQKTPVQSGRLGVRLISMTGSPAPAHST